MILDAGENRHTQVLANFLQKATTAQELLLALRERSPSCVHVVNKTHLVLEARAK
jgi:hypothetical protein